MHDDLLLAIVATASLLVEILGVRSGALNIHGLGVAVLGVSKLVEYYAQLELSFVCVNIRKLAYL